MAKTRVLVINKIVFIEEILFKMAFFFINSAKYLTFDEKTLSVLH
jgi:hypothetical protein